MRISQGIIFIWTQTHSEISKSALAYLEHTNKFYRKYYNHHHISIVFDLVTRLFLLIQSFQLLIFCLDDLEYEVGLNCVLFVLFSFVTSSKLIILYFNFVYCSNSVLHVFPAFAPYGYDALLSKFCNLLSSVSCYCLM